MQTRWNGNGVFLRGVIASVPTESHTAYGLQFFSFVLRVDRLSGNADALNILVDADTLAAAPFRVGQTVAVEGQLRSFNNKSGEGSKLVIAVLAKACVPADGAHENRVTVRGTVCKPPVLRQTPLGREICDMLLAVTRRYGRADYIPCILWGKVAKEAAPLPVGASVDLEGRLQSRVYFKVIDGVSVEKTAFEMSVISLHVPESASAESQ